MFLPRELWAHILWYCGEANERSAAAAAPWVGAALLRVSWSAHIAARAALRTTRGGRAFLRRRLVAARHRLPEWLVQNLADVLDEMQQADARDATRRFVAARGNDGTWSVRTLIEDDHARTAPLCRAAAVRNDPREWAVIAQHIPLAAWLGCFTALSPEALAAAVASLERHTARTPAGVVSAIANARAAGRQDAGLFKLVARGPRKYIERLRARGVGPFTLGPSRFYAATIADCVSAQDDAELAVAMSTARFRSPERRSQWIQVLWGRCLARRAPKTTEALVARGWVRPAPPDIVVMAQWCTARTLRALPPSSLPSYAWVVSLENPDAAAPLYVWSLCAAPDASGIDVLNDHCRMTEGHSRAHLARLRDCEELARLVVRAVPAHAPKYGPVLRLMCELPHRSVLDALVRHHDWNVAHKRHN